MTLADTSVWVDFFRGNHCGQHPRGSPRDQRDPPPPLGPWRAGSRRSRFAARGGHRRSETASHRPLRAGRRRAGARGRPTSLGTRDRLGRRPPPGLRTRHRLPPVDVRPLARCGSRGYRPGQSAVTQPREGYCQVGESRAISWGTRDARSIISWGRIRLEALNLTIPGGVCPSHAAISSGRSAL